MANLGSLVVSLEANIARFTSDMGRAAQQTDQAMNRMQASATQTQQAMQRLDATTGMVKASLIGMAGAVSLGAFKDLSDAAATVTGKIRMVTDSFSELKSVQAQLLATAQGTRQSFEATADLYSKVTRAADGLSLTQKDLVAFTGAVNNALVVSAAGAQQSEAAILQLGQAVASGKLGGDEFRSISENAPRLIQAIADGMGVARGQMKQYSTDGKLTAEVITQAIIGQFGKLETEAAKMPVTIGQSFQQLRNVMVDYMTSTGETSKVADAVATAVAGITNNLSKLEAVVAGLVSYKLAAWTIEIGAALIMKADAAYASAGALATERFATIAAAEANVVATESEVARIAAKAAFIAELRAEQVATVALANSIMLNSYSSAANTLALQSRSAAMVELAALGRAQIAVEAATTAATTASTVATTALTTARVAGAGSGAIAAAGALLMANPITAVTVALGLGVAAWMTWGDSAKESEKKASKEIQASTIDIVSDLDKQIKKLRERNALSGAGLKSIAKANTPEADRMVSLKSQIDSVSAGTGEYAGLDKLAKSDILMKLGMQYGELYGKIQEVAVEKDKLDGKTKSEKIEAWLEKNEQYLGKTQQLALKIKKAKDELGEAFTPAIEASIKKEFYKTDAKEAGTESTRKSKKVAEGNLKDLEEGLAAQTDAMAFADKYMAELRTQDLINLDMYNDYRKKAVDSMLKFQLQTYDKEIEIAEKHRDTLAKGSEKEAAQTKIDTIKAARAKAVQDAQQAGAMRTLELSAAQSQLNATMEEWSRQQKATAEQMQFENGLMGKSALEVANLTAERRIQFDIEEKIRAAKAKGDISDASIAKFLQDGKDQTSKVGSAITQSVGQNIIQGQRTPQEIEAEQHTNTLIDLQMFHDKKFENIMTANQAIERENTRHSAALRGIQTSTIQESLSMAGSSADQLYGLLKNAGMQQSTLARALFAVSKAIAIAEIIVNTEVAASKALALGPIVGPPLAATIRVLGYASAGVALGTAIASAEGGYDIPSGTNPVTQLHEKEMVLPKAQADVIRGLAGNGGKGGGGPTIHQTTTINIDSRSDQAQVRQLVTSAVQQGNADLVDKLQRAGRI